MTRSASHRSSLMRRLPLLRRSVLLAIPPALVAGALAGTSIAGTGGAGGAVRISTVSNRADLVSGGDALVRITTPGADAGKARVALTAATSPVRSGRARTGTASAC